MKIWLPYTESFPDKIIRTKKIGGINFFLIAKAVSCNRELEFVPQTNFLTHV